MIQNFSFILNNGVRTKVGEFLPSVPIIQQINDPEYRPSAYAWESDGQTFERFIDGCDTLTARMLPDGSGIVVVQDEGSYGSDNAVILNPMNEIRERISNPYRKSRFFIPGDKFWFDAVSIEPATVVLNIQAQRKIAKYPHDAVPIYEATYDPASMQLLRMEWKPWT
jgi:hypothetical protein